MNTSANKTNRENKTRHGQVAGMNEKTSVNEFHMDNNSILSPSEQTNGNIPPLPPEACFSDDLSSDGCPWLDEYVDFSRIWSPEAFDGYHEACGLFVLSTVAARRVIFNFGGVKATNLSILLVGRTSVHAKTTTAKIGVKLLREAGLDWMIAPEEITPEKLIEYMSANKLPQNYNALDSEEQKKARKRALTAGQKGWFLDEFGGNLSSMMQKDSVFSGIKSLILKLDDAPEKYEYCTISRGQNKIQYPYLSMLGNITIADLVPYAKNGSALWGDGFFPRFAMVVPPAGQLIDKRFPNMELVFPESLISTLTEWNDRLGLAAYEINETEGQYFLKIQPSGLAEMQVSQEVFNACYKYRSALKKKRIKDHNHDLDGNYARLHDKALRIAALFASIGGHDSIELNHWAKAQAITERWRAGLHELYWQINDHHQDPVKKLVKDLSIERQVLRAIKLEVMANKRRISQRTGLRKDILEPALENLALEKKILVIKENGKELYTLPD